MILIDYTKEPSFLEIVRKQFNQRMLEAAEPLIQEALTKIEDEMRKNLATNLVAWSETCVSYQRSPNHIDIRITLDPRKETPR